MDDDDDDSFQEIALDDAPVHGPLLYHGIEPANWRCVSACWDTCKCMFASVVTLVKVFVKPHRASNGLTTHNRCACVSTWGATPFPFPRGQREGRDGEGSSRPCAAARGAISRRSWCAAAPELLTRSRKSALPWWWERSQRIATTRTRCAAGTGAGAGSVCHLAGKCGRGVCATWLANWVRPGVCATWLADGGGTVQCWLIAAD